MQTAQERRYGTFDIALTGFILAGMALRLWALDAMEFKADELTHTVNAYWTARAPWSAPLVKAAGTPASPGAVFYQLLAVPAWVTQDPLWVTRVIALLNVAAILGLFGLMHSVFSRRVAFWTAALYATAPWLIVFSRKIWNPDLLLPLLILTLWFACSAMQRYRAWKVYGFAVALALLMQLHLSVWLAAAPVLALGLLLRPWRRPVDLAIGMLLFGGTHLLILGPRVRLWVSTLLSGASEQSDEPLVWLAAHNVRWSGRLASGLGFEYLLGPTGYAAFTAQPAVAVAVAAMGLTVVVATVGALHIAWRLIRAARASGWHAPERLLVVLVAMAASLHASYLLFRIASFPHYQIVLCVLPPLAIGLLLVRAADCFAVAGGIVARLVLVAILLGNVVFMTAFLTFVRTEPLTIDGDYGRPYFVDAPQWEAELEAGFRGVDARVGDG